MILDLLNVSYANSNSLSRFLTACPVLQHLHLATNLDIIILIPTVITLTLSACCLSNIVHINALALLCSHICCYVLTIPR